MVSWGLKRALSAAWCSLVRQASFSPLRPPLSSASPHRPSAIHIHILFACKLLFGSGNQIVALDVAKKGAHRILPSQMRSDLLASGRSTGGPIGQLGARSADRTTKTAFFLLARSSLSLSLYRFFIFQKFMSFIKRERKREERADKTKSQPWHQACSDFSVLFLSFVILGTIFIARF